MSADFAIVAEWETREADSPEEVATFAAIGIRHGDVWLTEAEDRSIRSNREKVHLSAYRLAEWLAVNWWRLRWEPRRPDLEWAMSHSLTSIGGGFVWPNITISSDGVFVEVAAKPTRSRPAEPLRYLADHVASITAAEFEIAVDGFNDMVCGRLRSVGIGSSNLQLLWQEVCNERADQALAQRRKLEALLGHDPDEAPGGLLDRLADDAKSLGESAVEELAAGSSSLPSSETIREVAMRVGQVMATRDAVPLAVPQLPGHPQPWQRGAAAAAAIRTQAGLTDAKVSDARLAELAGVPKDLLRRSAKHEFAFILDDRRHERRIVLRSPIRESRRFELARLIGDGLLVAEREKLTPATRSYTARQKAQRAFAAELLCPIGELKERLDDDLTSETMEEAAAYFEVSPLVVQTQLVNNGLLARERLLGAA